MKIELVDLQDDMYNQPRIAILTISGEAPEKNNINQWNSLTGWSPLTLKNGGLICTGRPKIMGYNYIYMNIFCVHPPPYNNNLLNFMNGPRLIFTFHWYRVEGWKPIKVFMKQLHPIFFVLGGYVLLRYDIGGATMGRLGFSCIFLPNWGAILKITGKVC